MLARFLPTMLRAMTSGRLGTVTVSPMVTIQPGPSAARLTRRGRSSLMRTIASPSAPRSSAALRIAWLASAVSAARSILAALSNTSHSVSARLEHGGRRRRPRTEIRRAKCRRTGCSSTTTGASGLGAGRLRSAAADFAGGCGARRGGFGAASRSAARLRRRRWLRLRRGGGGSFRRFRGGGTAAGDRLARHRRSAAGPARRHPRPARSRAARSPARRPASARRRCSRHRLRLGAVVADIDHDAAVLAEGAHLRRAVEREADGDRIVVDVGVDRSQRRRHRRLGVRQIPFDRLIEFERRACRRRCSGTTLAMSGIAKT